MYGCIKLSGLSTMRFKFYEIKTYYKVFMQRNVPKLYFLDKNRN